MEAITHCARKCFSFFIQVVLRELKIGKWFVFSSSDDRVRILKRRMTFLDGMRVCYKMKSELMEFESLHEVNDLTYILRRNQMRQGSFWIGYYFRTELKTVSHRRQKFMDKVTVKTPFCYPHCTSELCVSHSIEARLYAEPCNFKYKIVCRARLGKNFNDKD